MTLNNSLVWLTDSMVQSKNSNIVNMQLPLSPVAIITDLYMDRANFKVLEIL